jgi:ABC-type lipoprotein release transport system permease subunit
MTRSTLILRSLAFYWRTHLGVLLGAILTAGLLVGALVVGDSVRFSLKQMAVARLGQTELALTAPERFFRTALADAVAGDLKATVAPVLLWRGTVSAPDKQQRANEVQIVGVEERFWQVGGAGNPLAGAAEDEVVLNQRLAARLEVADGDRLVIRMEQPSFVSRDAPLSGKADVSVVLRAKVRAVAGDHEFGRFGLAANQVPPLTVFVPLPVLQAKMKRVGQANTLLVAGNADAAAANAAVKQHWTLADAGLEFKPLPAAPGTELRTDAVFLSASVVDAARSLATNSVTVLSYFVNELRFGEKMVPYSFVTAVGSELADNEITINSWLAEDLGVKVGDEVTLKYYVVGERRELREDTAKFRVKAVTPLVNDASWMPAYPGLVDAQNCRDWEPGIPIDNSKIRPKDEAYWKEYKGTPKGFVNLAVGQRLWNNRFGNVTAIRFPGGVSGGLLAKLDPAALGLFFLPVRANALAASGQAMDFGQLFIGFSFFLIIAALLLMALLFVFNLEQRNNEVGLLRAIGFAPALVRRVLLTEGLLLAVAGTVVGVLAGTVYTKLTLRGLATVWSGAIGAAELVYHAEPATLVIGAVSGLAVALLAMWLVVRGQARQAPSALLAGAGSPWERPSGRDRNRGQKPAPTRKLTSGLWTGIIFTVIALGSLAAAVGKGQSPEAAEYFFCGGMSLLIAGIGFSQRLLVGMLRTAKLARSVSAVGLRNASRRRGRSLATVSVLASGVFLVVAVNAFRRDPQQGAWARGSGTGGFALWAQSALPVYEDLNAKAGRDTYNLPAKAMQDVAIVPLRMREGDDASCLNLNRAQTPRIWGVTPGELAKRGAFTFASGTGWAALEQREADGTIPAIGDQQTVTWALGKKVGDVLTLTDDYGRECRLKIVAVTANSILQGGLLISEQNFVQRFPAASGYRSFLVDAPRERIEEVREALARGLEDKGLELVPAWKRLAEFLAVENTYLAIFQVLGGLGLLLGSVGLALVVLRNVLERRGELALLRAVGFEKPLLHRLVLAEHWLLIVLGLGCGVVAAVLAVLPAWGAPGAEVPVTGVLVTILALAVGGMAWCWVAALAALRGELLAGLRNE